jgi:hypothetical protein
VVSSFFASVFAEIEFLSRFLAQILVKGVAQIVLTAVRAQIVAEVVPVRFDAVGDLGVVQLVQKLADGFHVVLFEILLGQLGGVMPGEDLNLDDVMVLSRPQFLAAKITRNVQHEKKTSLTTLHAGHNATDGAFLSLVIRGGLPHEWKIFSTIHPSQVLPALSSLIPDL